MLADNLGRALVHRNYRLFLLGQGVSLIGTWMQQVAMSWLIYRLTASPFLLGLMSFASQIPNLVLSPFAGVAADRWNRHRALLVTQSLAMCQALLVLYVAYGTDESNKNIVWQLIGLGLFLGIVNSFDVPIRQSFLVEMVPDRSHLSNAIALNSSVVNAARLVGPSIAGLVIAAWGESTCFLFNAASYLAVLWALVSMRDLPPRSPSTQGTVLGRLKEGFVYAFGFAPVRALLLLLAVVSIMSSSLAVLMPVFAKDVFRGNANTQGLLMTSMGLGALSSALYLASRKSVLGLGRVIVLAAASYGLGQIAFSYCPSPWLGVPVLIVTGGAMMLQMAASNTLIQTIVDDDKRGRVMAMYTMAFLGVVPIGSLIGGTLAARIGAQETIRFTGLVCVIAAVVFGRQLPKLRHLVRPIYERAGILPKQQIEPVDHPVIPELTSPPSSN